MTRPIINLPVKSVALAVLLAAILPLNIGVVSAQDRERLLNATITAQAQTDTQSQRAQQTVARLADESNEYFADYRVVVQQLDQVKVYNANLEQLVRDQQREKASLRNQLENFGNIEEGIVPLMYELVASLKTFVQLDMPFLQSERGNRLERIEANLERSDLTVSEKYRQIMEAYQIETAYGRNIEAYPGTLQIDGVDRKVDLLRIGRIVLAYQTPDQAETGYWDKKARRWTALDDKFRRAVTLGVRIAKKQAAPTLLELPLPAAEDAR
ncbi:MAG: DUF3450 domain-containing protein [Gammaproteobacteria bacterium]|nr:DUF3450 domain-containing protein [Gammaproteobacteria bacterium]MDH3481147.1 DUF3450 domain-containing protein [Gammaproteobacteria bacterium]